MRRIDWVPPLAGSIALALIGAVEILLDPSFRLSPGAPATVLAVIVACALLSLRAPLWGAVLASVQFPLAALLGLNGPTGAGVLAFLLLPGWAGWRRPLRASWLAPLAAQLMAATGAAIDAFGGGQGTAPDLAAMMWENIYFSAMAWVSWLIGSFARSAADRAVRAEQLADAIVAEQRARERAILVEERQRIARDLHDSVAHSVSVMTLQVGALRATLPRDAPELELLRGIERLGRDSVDELRSAVGILRSADPEEPSPPSLARTAELLDEVRATGAEVAFTERGTPARMPRATDVSAFRVLQESLSNALRHAPGAPILVALDWAQDRLELRIENGRGAADPGPTVSGGHGLVGMRERLALAGGVFEAGPDGDGWRVRASFPLDQRAGRPTSVPAGAGA